LANYNSSIPRPKDWQAFERNARVLFACILDDPLAQTNGRSGQRQCGVDIYGTRKESGALVGIQCKGKDANFGRAVSTTELRSEVAEAKNFNPALDEFILITTAPDDVRISEEARLISDELKREQLPLRVAVWGWNTLEQHISAHRDAYKAFSPDATPISDELITTARQTKDDISEILRTLSHRAEELNLPLKKLLGRLPPAAKDFVGRDDDLDWLDAKYNDRNVSVVVLHAFGGVGKSTLSRRWLEQRFSKDTCTRFKGCSFYSQGVSNNSSSEQYIVDTLQELGLPEPSKLGSPWSRGTELAKRLASDNTVLVLDGLEPFQYGPGPTDAGGHLRDEGIRGLLASLLALRGPSRVFCVITSRLKLEGLKLNKSDQRELEVLSETNAMELLRLRGVDASDQELRGAAQYLGYHPLALVLAASYFRTFENGGLRNLSHINLLDVPTKEGRHAKSVMSAYEVALKHDESNRELELLYLFGLFDRAIQRAWLLELIAKPTIDGLTDTLVDSSLEEIQQSLMKLARWGLISEGDGPEASAIDNHPLVREYFGDRLNSISSKAFKAGHARVFEILKATSEVLPKTLQEMTPLFLCVNHGCKAGLLVRAFDEVYQPRIFQGPHHFAMQKLGAVRSLIGVLAPFFDDGNWEKPIEEARGGLPPAKLIEILLHAGMCHLQAQGYASPDAQSCYKRALQLVSPSATDSYFSVLWGLWVTSLVKGDLSLSKLFSDDLLSLAIRHEDRELLTEAHRVVGTTHYFRGNFKIGLSEFASGLSLYVSRSERKRSLLYLTDPKVNNLSYEACSLWFAGFPDRAVLIGEKSIRFAQDMDLRFSLIVAQIYMAWVYQYRSDVEHTERVARSALEYAQHQGFQHWENGAEILLGWVDMAKGQPEAAVERIECGIDGWRRNGARLIETYYHALLAEAYLRARGPAKALKVIDHGIEIASLHDERFFEAELWRLKGQCLAHSSREQSERCVSHAIEISEKQGSRSLQLRALTNWAALTRSADVKKDIRRRLTVLCATFSEGQNTFDFKAAELVSRTSE
jgi:predicted ATPase